MPDRVLVIDDDPAVQVALRQLFANEGYDVAVAPNGADAIELVERHDGKFPWTYLGEPLTTMLDQIDVSLDEFQAICDRFTNRRLFKTTRDGELVRDRHGNLSRVNSDNPE